MKRCCHGLSLTELLVATVLLATAAAGGLAALSRAYVARRDAADLQQLHERAQYVLATLEPELQMAGFFGTDAAPAALDVAGIPGAAQRCGLELVRRIDLPLEATAAWQLPCAANGGGMRAGTQALTVRRATARPADAVTRGRAQWHTPPHAASGRLYWNGEAPGAELRDLILRVYYVSRSADGNPHLPALRVKSLTSIAGVPAFVDTEVMNGVEDLQIELLPSPTAPRSARLRLRVRADEPALRGTAPRSLEATRQFTLRNAHW